MNDCERNVRGSIALKYIELVRFIKPWWFAMSRSKGIKCSAKVIMTVNNTRRMDIIDVRRPIFRADVVYFYKLLSQHDVHGQLGRHIGLIGDRVW